MAIYSHDDHPHAAIRGRALRPRAVARSLGQSERAQEALTFALYASLGGSGLLFLIGMVAYGYFTMLSML